MSIYNVILLGLMITLAVHDGVYTTKEVEDPYTSTDPSKREPTPCEICKYFATEFKLRLAESDKSKEMLATGHGLDKKKVFAYKTSELRLIEALIDPHICEKILEYNVHAEREGSLRYEKGMSETFQTLNALKNKGVQVELGIPHELWDTPSAEVTKMHRACFKLAERYEEDIEDWYYNHQEEEEFISYLCEKRYLKSVNWDKSCLKETWTGVEKRKDLADEHDQRKGDFHEHDDL